MPSDRPFTKDCDRCGQKIGFRKEGGKTIPINADGTQHYCTNKDLPQKPKEDSRIGTYGGISLRRINLTLKNGSIMVTEATPDLLKCLTDPNAAIKTGMKIKLVFAKDGKAEKAEICPDQPVPATPATVDKPTETCTSQKESPAQPTSQSLTKEEDVWGQEREEFCNLLTSTAREGMPDLIQYLIEKTDFFTAPSSAKYHDAVPGGLLHHSLKVYRNLCTLSKTFEGEYPEDTLKIIGLLHDICKVNFYKNSTRQVKKNLPGGFTEWVPEPYIDIDDQFPLGHGEKSVIMLQRYIQLTDTEIMGIRWHMMAYDDLAHSYAGNLAITNASSKYSIIPLMHIADLSASFLEVRAPAGGA